MIVMKFGGTSVESAAALERVTGIVKSRLHRKPVVVVSAMGKTTNRLLQSANLAVSGQREEALRELVALRDFHLRESGMERTVEEHFQELTELVKGLAVLGELTPRSIDAISSFGERLSSLIVTNFFNHHGLNAVHVDSRKLIVTDRRHTQAVPLLDVTYAKLAAVIPPLAEHRVVVMGGFIGATEDGITTTLGRGGSDFTASIAGAGIGAEEIQIWTDVDGMLTADPTVCPDAHRVKVISFTEAAELAYFGAKVLHPATILPAVKKNIPVWVLNSKNPESGGTRITALATHCKSPFKSIAVKKRLTIMDVVASRMLLSHGYLRAIFEVFDKHKCPVDMVSTSEVSVSLSLDSNEKLPAIAADLSKLADVKYEGRKALICMVGEDIRGQNGIAARVFQTIRHVNLRMISQGASEINMSFMVEEDDADEAVRSLHAEFFADADPAVFDLEPARQPAAR